MAPVCSSAQASSSSNTNYTAPSSYDVFLSFRGEDTRKSFTDHLYTAFVDSGLRTFRDDDELERGEDITEELKRAIRESQSSVIVFSKAYASSRWCLDELLMILELKKTPGSNYVLLPVFYDIDPSEVRKQTGNVAEALARHERRHSSEQITKWRAALTEVADLAGMVLGQGYESKFIKKIVKVIQDKLWRTTLSIEPYLVDMDFRVKDINLWLQDGSTDVGILAIFGMRGIGKTTTATFVYNSNFKKFERSSFLENIREVSQEPKGLIRLQKQLLCDVLNKKKVRVRSVSEGVTRIKDAFRSKRVLLVLDDMDHMDQMVAILGMKDQFYPGSKIIVTTSNERLLKAHHQVMKVHNVRSFDYNESLKLFSWHAFGQEYPPVGYMEHAKTIVQQSEGLPLALKILGSSLSGQSIVVWESALDKLKAIPNGEILKKLRISFDSLQDDHDRNLFLHIACFFTGMDKDAIIKILDGCDFYTTVGIESLIERCLVTIDRLNNVQMHHMIRDMGRGIVRLESEEPGERSRLWHHVDSFRVLTEKNGTQKIEGLMLNMHMHPAHYNASGNSNDVVLEINAFAEMRKLRLLQLCHVQLNGCYEEFPKGLRWLCWFKSHLQVLPNDFPMKSLVGLEMCYSSLRQVWEKSEHFPSLKILNLSHSHCLTETPDFSFVPNLESLNFQDCASLVFVHESIGNLENLVHLNMEDCKSIKKFPKNISKLKCLETLIISGCSSLDEFPMDMRTVESLKVFEADGVPIKQFIIRSTGTFGSIPNFFWDSYLPCNILDLSLGYCNLSDGDFPKDFSNLRSLRSLNLSGNSVLRLPACISGLTKLDELSFSDCKKLISLEGIPRVGQLIVYDCISLKKMTYKSTSYLPKRIGIGSNWSLVELQYCFTLKEGVDEELNNLWGLSNFTSAETIVLKSRHEELHSKSVPPIQGLYENGIFSTFLPGIVVPEGRFSHKCIGRSIFFTVPILPQTRIRGLNLFCVYTNCTSSQTPFSKEDPPIMTLITNKSKGLTWTYGPLYYGVPSDGKYVTWLSHWKFGDQWTGGDEVEIHLYPEVGGFEINECGIQVDYYEQEEEVVPQGNTTDPFYPNIIAGDKPKYGHSVFENTYFIRDPGPTGERGVNYFSPSFNFIRIFDRNTHRMRVKV